MSVSTATNSSFEDKTLKLFFPTEQNGSEIDTTHQLIVENGDPRKYGMIEGIDRLTPLVHLKSHVSMLQHSMYNGFR